MTENFLKIHDRANAIIATRLDKMRETPMFIPEALEPRILTAQQFAQLSGALKNSKSIDPSIRFKTCNFFPGVKFTFRSIDSQEQLFSEISPDLKNKDRLSVLLCFNCDIWALSDAAGKMIYGDAKNNRDSLIELARELYGKDFI